MLAKLKKFMPKSLFGRTLMILFVPAILAQVIAIYIFYERHLDNVNRHMASSLAGEMVLIVKQLEETPETNLKQYTDNLPIISARVGKFPQHRGDSWQKFDHPPYSSVLDKKLSNDFAIYRSLDGDRLLTRIKIDRENWLEIITSKKRLFTSTSYIFIGWMVCTTGILILISALFMKNQIRPIIRLARSADVFGRGQDLPTNFKPEGAYEVRTASSAFIKMRERIQRFIRQRTEMLAGISHDLRTPLTRLKLEIEMLKGKIPAEDVAEMTKDITEMQQMIDSYINFVRSDEEEDSVEVNIGEVLRNVGAKFKAEGADIEIAEIPNCDVTIKEGAITRAICNLIENALKYAGQARVSTKETHKTLSILIEDNGAGIPKDERELVLRPFYRIESSRNPETGGSGLGLAIVQDITNNHGGTLELKESELGGLLVKLNLPK